MKRALVLGAGGHAATAWEIGVIAGLADGGVDLRGADLVIGTSAGSIVGAQLTSGLAIEEMFKRQIDPDPRDSEPPLAIDFATWGAAVLRAKEHATNPAAFLQRIGTLEPVAPDTPRSNRRTVIATRLPVQTWPARRLLVVAVDAQSGERHVFDRDSEADLVDAVTASCAVAGIWPSVRIEGRRYIDGGFYSIDNADLAAGAERVLILTLPARVPRLCVASLDSAVEALRARHAAVDVVLPDASSQEAFAAVGGNLLDPAVREAAARAGREQGRSAAASITF